MPLGIGLGLDFTLCMGIPSAVAPSESAILKEDGDMILLETGDVLLME